MIAKRITLRLPPEFSEVTAQEALRAIRYYRKHRTRQQAYRKRQKAEAPSIIEPNGGAAQ